jgi:hypothetical protein
MGQQLADAPQVALMHRVDHECVRRVERQAGVADVLVPAEKIMGGAEPTTVEEATVEIARLRAQLAALSEAYSHQKAVIRGSMELLSAAPH